ncbi:MAG: DNA alkylation repair protein [Candidatus Nealsonbacteria bacterium RBG_13_38_11]|uniref:DNA alkylation repair protein n=1 Tax=Candidatus Nealsonbacteria bacterium RBG_13_38_11 TaxID=1801662 RepID=A0A1G2DZM1_9BACT|nr:MAG: DNA alkylation repair protein [Candidatus Nealsonbacteria bacterium RBG_13_38_11]HXK32161.1 DNA alkylation repair protein [Candidatus Paceibacterota bacterium]
MNSRELIKKLKSLSNPKNVAGMARFGINSKYALGIRVPVLRDLAKRIGKSHKLAQDLWKSRIHEARILASTIDEADKVTEKQMELWVKEFNSWDLCDQCCMNLFDKTAFNWKKAIEWAKRKEEFVRRAGFALMASLAVHDKKAKNEDFFKFFPYIKKHSTDERNFVKKAVNWALRQIGKRNAVLREKCIKLAKEIQKTDSKSAQWIAKDAIRELVSKR